ncbi:MAG: hypothetical protein ISR69_12830 [Gammaproteobacteria bacterium]|nr:hypothetical protein [Gammaproteobacteria bacterium]
MSSSFKKAIAKGIDEDKSDFEMLPEVLITLAPFSQYFRGLEDKLRRNISSVFLQVEKEMFE